MGISALLRLFYLAISELFPNFAQHINTVQFKNNVGGTELCPYQRHDRS